MLPERWKKISLADVVSQKISYGIVQAGPHVNGGVPYIKSSDVRDDISLASLQRTSAEIHKKYIRSSVHPGDIVFSLRGNIGATCIVPSEISEANLTQGTARISCSQKVYPNFLIQELRTSSCIQQALNLSKGSTFKEVSLESLRTLKVIIPPLPEQKKIAAILSTWDRAIEGTEKLLANSQQQKKALMQQLLTGKKRLPGFTGEWKTVTIGSLLKEVKRPAEWKDDNFYKLLSVKRRSEGVILREVLHGTKILTKKMNHAKSGDFLISKMQVVHGASGLVPEHLDNHHISDSYIALRAKNTEKFDIEFFSWLSKERFMYYKTFLCSYGVTIEKMTFNFNMYLKEYINIPSTIAEQRSISQILNTTENEITALESDLSRLRQEKKALMQQLLTGKRRVTVD